MVNQPIIGKMIRITIVQSDITHDLAICDFCNVAIDIVLAKDWYDIKGHQIN